jgi:hypothetical protein
MSDRAKLVVVFVTLISMGLLFGAMDEFEAMYPLQAIEAR